MLNEIVLILTLSACFSIELSSEEDQIYWKNNGAEELKAALNIEQNTNFAKNVIIFVGDGMGLTTITASRIYSKGESGFLAWEKFNHIGVLKTYSNNKLVPDSCSTATALFTGVKANHETSGADGSVQKDDCLSSLDESARPSSIFDWAIASGKATGFVTTTRVTHATPSALYAHSANRKWECEAFMPPNAQKCTDIAYQLVKENPGKKINVIMGGGRQVLQSNATGNPGDPLDTYSCRRMDGKDLIEEWKKDRIELNATHAFISNTGELEDLDENTEYVMGIFANGHMQPDCRRDKSRNGMPSLRNMTEKAVKLLRKNAEGFILMVEGGLIDLSHHRGHAKQALDETRAFSEAVEGALSLVDTKETLVIVTSDHSHSLSFIGYLDRNRSIFDVASHLVGGNKTPYTSILYAASGKDNYQYYVDNGTVVRRDPSGDDKEDFNYSQQTGMLDSESPHGGTDVLIYATGPMSHLVHSVREQTFVAYLIKYAAKIGEPCNGSSPQSKMNLAYIQIPYVLYTHKLYIDSIASSEHTVLTSWKNGTFTRPNLDLFPRKFSNGFAGHRFMVSLAQQEPFVIKRGVDANDEQIWDGIEVRIVELLAKIFNFTTDYREAEQIKLFGSADAVLKDVEKGKTNLGISGIFVSSDVISKVDVSNMFYQDCAAFMTLTSTALPRYRAIMGPFHWSVWLCLTMIYLFAIFPLWFSDKHTLKPLLKNPEEMENLFWYVFGTFTNAFTVTQKDSWTNSDKLATKIFIGFYWLFTIIISACYTGSIIAFITIPVYPETIDSVSQLLNGRYQIGTLDKAGWVNRFDNSSDKTVSKLLRKVDLVPNLDDGIRNITKAFFWPYAFLGSKANLDYTIRTKYATKTGARAVFHVSDECLVSYSVALIYPKNSEYKHVLNTGLDLIVQSGFIDKIKRDVEWLIMRSPTGKLLAVKKGKTSTLFVEDRALNLDDTQGMFLLLAIGYVMAGICLLTEWFGGCFNLCKTSQKNRFRDDVSLESNPRSYNGLTPRQRMKNTMTMVYSNMIMLRNIQNHFNQNDDDGDFEDIDKKIDKLFDFENVFGEKSGEALQNSPKV